MCFAIAVTVGLLAVWPAVAREPANRYGLDADPKGFPQATPQEALASVVKAADLKRIDYLLAQLADPSFVDGRVQVSAGGFADLVAECTDKLVNDPAAVRLLQRLAKEGEWKVEGDAAAVALKDGPDKSVTFRKTDGRWVMQNPYRPKAVRKGRGER